MRRDRDVENVEKEETWGGVSPHHPTRDLGARHKLPSGVRGRAPAENGFYAYFRLERSHLEHPFSTVERWRGPQTSRGPGKLPLSTGLEREWGYW